MEKSFKRGEFTLSSGQKSNYYIDARLTTLDARGAYLVARIFLAMLADDVPDAVGGPTLGADPIIGSMLSLAGLEDLDLRGFIVRKRTKEHGTQSLVEGSLSKGDRVVIIEDVLTTGSSSLKAIEAVRGLGCEVVRVLAVVDREQGAKENLREAGCHMESIFTVGELLRVG
ncbi:MAG: orotate phosphoribosyltransferase [Candidatus Latescibacterota bacterium]|nr:MAG: orotate phosphoribosyltransferase [Candidatus Latescibacterota bacterium]